MAGGSHQDSHENLSLQAVLTEVWVAPFIVSTEGSVGCLPLSPGDTLSLDRTLQTPCLTSSPHTCDLHLELKKLLFFMNPSLRYSAMVTESSKEAHQGLASPTRCHLTPPSPLYFLSHLLLSPQHTRISTPRAMFSSQSRNSLSSLPGSSPVRKPRMSCPTDPGDTVAPLPDTQFPLVCQSNFLLGCGNPGSASSAK